MRTDLTPTQTLVLAMLICRGGRADEEQIAADCDQWIAENGEPTVNKVREWCANSVEYKIGLAATPSS